MNTERINYT